MYDDRTLFQKTDKRSETLTVRLTYRQKERVSLLAKRKGVSVSEFILDLLAQEHERQFNADMLSGDDGMPF